MPSFLDKLRSSASSNTGPTSSPGKKDAKEAQQTWLQKLQNNAGPVKEDGSDKFFGAENFGNTCYFNSIIQCLYYNVHFREMVLNYPSRSPKESILNGPDGKVRQSTSHSNGPVSPGRARAGASPGGARVIGVSGAPQKPEDRESPEYKKKQAMANGPRLVLDYDNSSTYGMTESLFTCLKDTFEAIIANPSRTGVISPSAFLEMLRKENEMFRSSMHQDAHEFLNLLLNGVVEAVEEHSRKLEESQGANGHVANGGITKAHAASSTTTTKPSAIHGLFEGTLTSETKCLTCENISQRDEPFLDLSVDLDQHSSVTSCLRKFSEEEMLCERDKFFCDNCGGLQEAEKRMKIKRLPKILALHLKRFKYTEDLQRLQKLFHRVVYPYHLRLFNTTDDAEDPDRLYELYAVVVHIGSGPYHGHYVSIIKTPDRGWLLFDDEMVEPVDKSFVRNFFGAQIGMACAYVLFYQETTLEAVKKEQEAEGLAAAAAAAAAATTSMPNGKETHGLGLSLRTNGSHNSPTSQLLSPHEQDATSAPLSHAVTAPVTSNSNSNMGSPISPSTTLQATPMLPSQATTPGLPSSLPQAFKPSTAAFAAVTNPTSLPLSPTKADLAAAKKQAAREEKERKAAEKERDRAEKAAEKAKRKSMETRYRESVRAQATSLISSLSSSGKKSTAVSGIEEEPPKPPSTAGSAGTAEILSSAQPAQTPSQPPAVEALSAIPPYPGASTALAATPGATTTPGTTTSRPPPPATLSRGTTQPAPETTSTRAGSFSGGATGALSRFRQSSKSLSRKPKFWSSSTGTNSTSGDTPAPALPSTNNSHVIPNAPAATANASENRDSMISSGGRELDDVAVEDGPADDGDEAALVGQHSSEAAAAPESGGPGLGISGTPTAAAPKKRGFSIRKKASAMLS